ncbi:MAG: hypothetical protein Unbinned1190contig1000_8 [Prokaryotic dsDNA virus sp.]|nr:MAG: hypothetical protein Unbinned1190contig1000_8 [Prokaryotic dsDNA virus sp.]
MRGAEMLHFATTKLPIIWANVGCAERLKKDGQDNKEDTEEEDKAKKVGV